MLAKHWPSTSQTPCVCPLGWSVGYGGGKPSLIQREATSRRPLNLPNVPCCKTSTTLCKLLKSIALQVPRPLLLEVLVLRISRQVLNLDFFRCQLGQAAAEQLASALPPGLLHLQLQCLGTADQVGRGCIAFGAFGGAACVGQPLTVAQHDDCLSMLESG